MERQTRQKAAIWRVLVDAGRPLSPREVLAGAQSHVPRLGIATVYRTLKTLLEAGELAAVNVPGESARFEIAGKGHHDHFHCRGCNLLFEIHSCPVRSPRAPRGFKVEGHEVVLHGLCAACRGER